MPPKTVLSVLSTLARCGVVNVLEGIVRNCHPDQWRCIVATLSPEPVDSLLGHLRRRGINVAQINLSRISSLVAGRSKLRKLVKLFDVSIVHSHSLRADTLVAWSDLGIPIISTLHADLQCEYQLAYGEPLARVLAALHYAALKRFDRVISVSDYVSHQALMHNLPTEVIRNGIELDVYCPLRNEEDLIRSRDRLGFPQRRPVVLHDGVLIRRKRPVEVIVGFRNSRSSEIATLFVSNDGPLRKQCERAARGADNIQFLGKRSDTVDLLQASDILISNSSAEGLPMALLEACACGLHVLASDIPPHRQLRHLFPKQVSLFSGGDACKVTNALDAIGALVVDKYVAPSSSALESISSKKMSKLYQKLLQGP